MSQNEQDEYEPSAEELEALLDESKLTNEYIRQLEADFMPVTKLETTFDTAIVVDNLPVVGEDKREKLMRIIQKIYSQFGPIRENGFCLPTDSKGTTKGYAFIEFETPEVARLACEKTQGHKLDKQHIFAVNLYSDFEKLMAVPDEYVPPQVKEHEEGDNLRWWLQEPRGMEQYVIRQGEETEIYWNETLRKPEPIYKRSRWTDTYVRWSPRGSYMATLHVPGVILWGGEKWNKINRFQHPGVKLIDFSPCENYLITWSPQFLEHDNPKDPQCIIIWDIKKGTKLRGLPAGLLGPNGIHPWPNFFWTHDDKYFARLGKDAIMVYDSADMTLLDKKSIKIPGVRDFAWSPTEHVFACWVPEEGNSPARVILREIPSRKEIRNKTLFNVSDCKIHWQEQGNFLCVKVDRYTKKKKSTYTNFELFRIRENGMPSELLEIKDTILWFAWEPRGKRFAIIHGDGNLRYNVSIYRMGKNQLKHLVTLENRAANTLCWSPRGNFLILAGMRNLNGTLEFYNTDELQTMGEGDHFMCTDLEWDPTGRYLCTSVSAWRQQMESGYTIWRFDGKIIHKIMKDRFFQFHWRPRPPSLLSDEQEVKIRKNLKDYTKRFAQLDAKEKKQFKSAHFAEKQRLIDEFAEWENRWRQAAEAERAQREKIPVRSSVRPDQYEEIVEKVEEVVEIIEEEL